MNNLRPVRITYEDGSQTTTSVNGTDEDINRYFLNQTFNFGDTEEHPADKLLKAIKVEFLDKEQKQ